MNTQEGLSSIVGEADLSTEQYTYTFNDETELRVHTDPAGLWHAGVAATVWDSSLILAKHLEKVFHDHSISTENSVVSKLTSQQSLKVLELGAGCSALPSLVMLRLRSILGKETRCVVTDKQSSLPLLTRTMEATEFGTSASVQELDWTERNDSAEIGSDWDVILASDLLAFPDLYKPLNYTLRRLSSEATVVYIAYERRDFSAEIEFFRELGKDYTFEMVPENELDDIWRAPGEIYLYRATLRSAQGRMN